MAEPLQVTELDFDQIKQNLKSYLQQQTFIPHYRTGALREKVL